MSNTDVGIEIESTKLLNLEPTNESSISTFRAEVTFSDGTVEYARGMYDKMRDVFYNVEAYEDKATCRKKYVRLEMNPEIKVRSNFKIVDVDVFNVTNFSDNMDR